MCDLLRVVNIFASCSFFQFFDNVASSMLLHLNDSQEALQEALFIFVAFNALL
jgi:hypothetical protein